MEPFIGRGGGGASIILRSDGYVLERSVELVLILVVILVQFSTYPLLLLLI